RGRTRLARQAISGHTQPHVRHLLPELRAPVRALPHPRRRLVAAVRCRGRRRVRRQGHRARDARRRDLRADRAARRVRGRYRAAQVEGAAPVRTRRSCPPFITLILLFTFAVFATAKVMEAGLLAATDGVPTVHGTLASPSAEVSGPEILAPE